MFPSSFLSENGVQLNYFEFRMAEKMLMFLFNLLFYMKSIGLLPTSNHKSLTCSMKCMIWISDIKEIAITANLDLLHYFIHCTSHL